VVLGIKAKLVVVFVATFVSKNAKASENEHWKVPYSSEAKRKLKLMKSVKGIK